MFAFSTTTCDVGDVRLRSAARSCRSEGKALPVSSLVQLQPSAGPDIPVDDSPTTKMLVTPKRTSSFLRDIRVFSKFFVNNPPPGSEGAHPPAPVFSSTPLTPPPRVSRGPTGTAIKSGLEQPIEGFIPTVVPFDLTTPPPYLQIPGRSP